jgi:hypothetical protein
VQTELLVKVLEDVVVLLGLPLCEVCEKPDPTPVICLVGSSFLEFIIPGKNMVSLTNSQIRRHPAGELIHTMSIAKQSRGPDMCLILQPAPAVFRALDDFFPVMIALGPRTIRLKIYTMVSDRQDFHLILTFIMAGCRYNRFGRVEGLSSNGLAKFLFTLRSSLTFGISVRELM